MKFTSFAKNSKGIGLIEVLVATVVVAVGLLSVASLQSELVSGSRSNKTRAEAKALADTKIEQLRDTIEKTGTAGYNALASSAAESIPGITETFTRSWVVTNKIFDLTNQTWVPATFITNTWDPTTSVAGHTYSHQNAKEISVIACWSDGCTGNVENQVRVQSVIAFDNLGNSMLTAQGGVGTFFSGPSLNPESSHDISKSIDLPPGPNTPNTIYTAPDNQTYIVQNMGIKGTLAKLCRDPSLALIPFENNLFTRRIDFDQPVTGKEAIELYEKVTIDNVDYCIPRIRFDGGVIIPIRGIVHSGATTGNGNNQTLLDVNLFTFNATESGTFCVFKPTTDAKSAPYVCYIGGNCTFGPNGTHKPDGTTANSGDDTIVTECPNPAVSAATVGPGGWRGKVGLSGIATKGDNVCFAEEVAAAPATLDTARNYLTRNAANGLNEGINKPYDCHDFLIINGKNTEAQVHSECVIQKNAIGTLILASKNIQRDINGNNVFDPTTDTSYCAVTGTSHTIIGTIANANSSPTVTVTDAISINACTATASTYSCQINTSASSVTVSGVYNAETRTCTASPSASGCALSFTATANPTYTINGNIGGTSAEANAVTLALSNGSTCVNNNNGTYSCSVTTPSTTTSVTLTAAISTPGGTVTPNTAQTITLPGSTSTLTGPDFNATVAATYTISGTISIGDNVTASSIKTAVVTGTGICNLTGTHAENTSDNYSCTVISGANDLTVSISPACSTNGGSKKYEMTDGTTTTLGIGSLVIHFNNITGNTTKNITITKSSTGC